MASDSTAYPMVKAPRTLDSVIRLSDDVLATYAAKSVTAERVFDQHAILFDASGKPLTGKVEASKATFAIWANVSTRYGQEHKLATMLRACWSQRAREVRPADLNATDAATFVEKLAIAANEAGLFKAQAARK